MLRDWALSRSGSVRGPRPRPSFEESSPGKPRLPSRAATNTDASHISADPKAAENIPGSADVKEKMRSDRKVLEEGLPIRPLSQHNNENHGQRRIISLRRKLLKVPRPIVTVDQNLASSPNISASSTGSSPSSDSFDSLKFGVISSNSHKDFNQSSFEKEDFEDGYHSSESPWGITKDADSEWSNDGQINSLEENADGLHEIDQLRKTASYGLLDKSFKDSSDWAAEAHSTLFKTLPARVEADEMEQSNASSVKQSQLTTVVNLSPSSLESSDKALPDLPLTSLEDSGISEATLRMVRSWGLAMEPSHSTQQESTDVFSPDSKSTTGTPAKSNSPREDELPAGWNNGRKIKEGSLLKRSRYSTWKSVHAVLFMSAFLQLQLYRGPESEKPYRILDLSNAEPRVSTSDARRFKLGSSGELARNGSFEAPGGITDARDWVDAIIIAGGIWHVEQKKARNAATKSEDHDGIDAASNSQALAPSIIMKQDLEEVTRKEVVSPLAVSAVDTEPKSEIEIKKPPSSIYSFLSSLSREKEKPIRETKNQPEQIIEDKVPQENKINPAKADAIISLLEEKSIKSEVKPEIKESPISPTSLQKRNNSIGLPCRVVSGSSSVSSAKGSIGNNFIQPNPHPSTVPTPEPNGRVRAMVAKLATANDSQQTPVAATATRPSVTSHVADLKKRLESLNFSMKGGSTNSKSTTDSKPPLAKSSADVPRENERSTSRIFGILGQKKNTLSDSRGVVKSANDSKGPSAVAKETSPSAEPKAPIPTETLQSPVETANLAIKKELRPDETILEKKTEPIGTPIHEVISVESKPTVTENTAHISQPKSENISQKSEESFESSSPDSLIQINLSLTKKVTPTEIQTPDIQKGSTISQPKSEISLQKLGDSHKRLSSDSTIIIKQREPEAPISKDQKTTESLSILPEKQIESIEALNARIAKLEHVLDSVAKAEQIETIVKMFEAQTKILNQALCKLPHPESPRSQQQQQATLTVVTATGVPMDLAAAAASSANSGWSSLAFDMESRCAQLAADIAHLENIKETIIREIQDLRPEKIDVVGKLIEGSSQPSTQEASIIHEE